MAVTSTHAQELESLGQRLEALRLYFQRYIQGLERLPPTEEREKLKSDIAKIKGSAARWNTADRFKLNAIYQKFQTYDRMWTRTLKEMEDGTFWRDRNKVKRKREHEGEAPSPASLDPALPPPARRPAAGGDGGDTGGMTEERMRRLYSVYVQAKKRTGESTNLTYESLRAQIAKQVPVLKKKHGCETVDFKVVLKDGKAMLKAVPK